MPRKIAEQLLAHGVQPSAHRVAVAEYVLTTAEHPSAERVLSRVRERFPMISRATVYNALNLFVEKKLLRELHLAPESVVFDPNTERHHHVIDDDTGRIYDIPWNELEVRHVEQLRGFEVSDYQVVIHGRRRKRGLRP